MSSFMETFCGLLRGFILGNFVVLVRIYTYIVYYVSVLEEMEERFW